MFLNGVNICEVEIMRNIRWVILLIVFFLSSANLKSEATFKEGVTKTTAVVSGICIGPFVGAGRGLAKGATWGTMSVASGLGDEDGIPHTVVGAVTGGVVGGFAGGVAGLFKGPYDAVRYGIDKPFSQENFSTAGQDFLDYEPFDWSK